MAAAEALGVPRSYQGSQHSLQRGLACVPGHTFLHTQTQVHIFTVCAQRSTTTHTCLTYTSRDMLVLSVCRSTPPDLLGRMPAQRSTQTHARYTTSCLITPAVIKQTQQRLTPSRRLLAQKHTLTHPQTHLAMSRDGHTLETPSDISEAHMHMRAHTQTHTESLHTGARIHGNPQIRPCQAGTDTAHHAATPAASSTKRASSRGPCTPGAHRHTPKRHT